MSTDHSDLQIKLLVRQKAIRFVAPPYKVLEMYSGAGTLTNMLWAKIATEVLAIEKKPGKFQCTQDNVTGLTDTCYNHMDKCKDYNIIDCDAYGMVLPVVLKCIAHASPETAICFTEFNPVRYGRDWVAETIKALASHRMVRAFWFQQASNSPVIYGYVII